MRDNSDIKMINEAIKDTKYQWENKYTPEQVFNEWKKTNSYKLAVEAVREQAKNIFLI